jgi:hypothetical protein
MDGQHGYCAANDTQGEKSDEQELFHDTILKKGVNQKVSNLRCCKRGRPAN